MRRLLLSMIILVSFLTVKGQSEALSLESDLQSTWLLEVEGDTVNAGEFWRVFNKNNFKQEVPTKEAILDYFELYKKFKLKVTEAQELGLDTTAKFLEELAGYQKQLAQSYLTDKSVTEELVKEAYQRSTEEVSASHILIQTKYNALPSDTMEQYKKALMVKQLADKGYDFDSLAVLYSEDPSAVKNKGYLGYFGAFKMVYPFECGAFETQAGEVSELVRTRFGYHIIKVWKKRKSVGEIKIAHIMLVAHDTAQVELKEKKKKQIAEVYEKLQEGENFELLARKYSEHYSSAGKGGELPWFGAGQYDEEFEKTAFSLEGNGAYSEPIRTTYGYHILKRLDRKPVQSFEEMEASIRRQVGRSDRAEKSRDVVLARIKRDGEFKESKKRKALQKFFDYCDSTIVTGTWKAPTKAKLKKVMFKFDDKKYTQKDFANYIEATISPRGGGDYRQLVNFMYEQWIEKICFDRAEELLPQSNPEYVRLLQEYKDGIILFELTDRKVWSKAVSDTIGLKAHYEDNKDKWKYDTRVKGELYTCSDKKNADEVLKMIKKGKDLVAILEKINTDSQLNVRVENVYADTIQKPILKNFDFKLGTSSVVKINESFVVLKVLEVQQPTAKKLEEVRGLVTAAYQDKLMEEWIKALEKKYRLTFNRETLKAVLAHGK